MPTFDDRADAGRRLAERLSGERAAGLLVLGLPRGGVPVASEVARALGAELDVLVARKVAAPDEPELGIGAIAEGGVRVLDEARAAASGLDDAMLEELFAREDAELGRRARLYRAGRPQPPLAGRPVIVVDDGLASGVSAMAALRAARAGGPARLVLAVPVGDPGTVRRLASEADEVVCLEAPPGFAAVGSWYRDFSPTPDEMVVALLDRARPNGRAGP